MKKLLYTTSALVGAAFLMEAVAPAKAEVNISMRYRAALESQSKKAADKVRNISYDFSSAPVLNAAGDLGVSGVEFTETSTPKDRSTRLNSSKIDIGISASKDHPNGLTTGASLAVVTAARKLDYNNAIGYVSGSFGKFEVGDFHDVGYRALGYGVPGTSNFGAVDAGFQPSGGYINTSATGNIGGRASSLAYWSPSFSGAQVGISWAPQVSKEGKEASLKSADGDIEDSIGLVATYSGSFGGTGVSMGVSYETAETVSGGVDGYTDSTESDDSRPLTTPTPTNTATLTTRLREIASRAQETVEGSVGLLIGTGGTAARPVNSLAGDLSTNRNGVTDPSAITLTKQNQDPSAFAGYISFDIQGFTVGGSYGVWEHSAANANVIAESTAYALGASYSIDAITFGIGYALQSTDNTHHNLRVNSAFTATGNSAATVNASSPYKQTLDSSLLAFTVGYQLGDGASLDFVIEQSTTESMVTPTGNATASRVVGKKETDSSGFGIGIDLKF